MYVKEPSSKRYRLASDQEIAVALSSRLQARYDRKSLTTPDASFDYLRANYAMETQEVCGCLLLDNQLRLISIVELARGTISECAVHPRQIAKAALDANASGVMLFHNHPTGVPTPSGADINFTRKTNEALKLFGIQLHDHFIVGGAEVLSMARRGYMD
jgi:DNA repair protein RadC